ncbi:TonB-dependent receptor [Ottowia sp.]|uniref:TonB-dependent receptor n=1 Tax=Ottowia sp. TaxID=1898956 RepID=UPI003A8379B3
MLRARSCCSPLLAALGWLTLPAWALAQTQAADADAEVAGTLETVTVQASADASAEGLSKPFAGGQVARGSRIGVLGTMDQMSTPFSATSYTHQLIEDQQSQSVGDVLRNDAAVRPARGFGNFQQAYFIRGFTVYSDDIAYNGLYGLVPRQYMATEFVERVEVFRGANAFLSGAGAGSVAGGGIGGLINVLPKRAGNEPLSQVTLGGQTGGQGYLAADLARRFGPDGSTGIRLNLARRDGGTGVHDEKQELTALAVGLDWRSRNVRLSADFGLQNNHLRAPRPSVTPAAGLALPDTPDARDNFAQPWTYSDSRDRFATVRGEVDLSDRTMAWAALGARYGHEENRLVNPREVDTAGNFSAYRFDNTRRDRVFTGELGVRTKFDTGSVGHTVTASASLFQSRERNAYAMSSFTSIGGNLYNPVVVAPPVADTYVGGDLSWPHATARINNTSVALADTLSMLDDRLLVTLGARYQTLEDKAYDYNSGQRTSHYDEHRVTPVAGVVFKPTKEFAVYANYIEALVKGDTASGVGVINVGQVFAPYRSKQKEVGLKWENGKLGASVAYFTTDKPLSGVFDGVYGPYGKQRNQGVELNVFGEPVKGLRVLGGATFLDAKQRRTAGGVTDGKRVIGVPRHQFNLGADWDVPGVRGLALDARVIYTGKQYADAANTQSLPSSTRWDAGVRYMMDIGSNRLLTLRGRVENLTNKSYWESAGGYPGYGYLVMAKPRTFSLTASVAF